MSSAKDFVFNLLADDSKASKTLDGFSKYAGKIATGIAAAWAGAKIGDAITQGLDIEAGNAKLSASMGLTVEESKRIGSAAGKVFADNYGENIGEVNAAISGVVGSFDGMKDASESDLKSMTANVINFAKAFEIDVTRATQVAGQMVKAGFAKDGTEALDLLTASLQKVPVDMRENILDAVDEYGPFMHQLGISGEAGMTMLVDASAKGQYGIDKVGDALKEFTIRATDMSTSTGTAYEALGLNQEKMTNALLAGGQQGQQAFAQIVLGLQGIKDPAAQSQAALALFGTPLEDLGTGEIPKFIDGLANIDGGLGDVTGATQRMGDTLNDTKQNRIESIKRGFESWQQSMVNIPGPLGDITAGVVAFGPGLLQAVAALGPMAVFMGGPFATAMGVAGTAVRTAGLAFLTSPITWIVLGIVAAILILAGIVYLVITNWGGISKWFGELWTNIWNGIKWFFGLVMEGFLNFTPLGLIIKNWGAITDFFGKWWSGLVGMVGDWVKFLGNKVGEIVGFFTSIPTRIGDAWSGLVGLIQGVVKNILKITVDIWNSTLGTVDFKLPDWMGGARIKFPKFKLPALADGGIVTGPTIALIGEAGPEAVVPLSKGGDRYGLSAPRETTVEVPVVVDGRVLWKVIKKVQLREG